MDLASSNASPSALGITDEPREATNAYLAPSALLAIVLRSLVGQLVRRGVDAFRRDEAALRDRPGLGPAARPRRRNGAEAGDDTTIARRVLTPAHVLGGVARHARAGVVDSALFLVCATLGEGSGAGAGSGSVSGGLEATGADSSKDRTQGADARAVAGANRTRSSETFRAEKAQIHYAADDLSPVAKLRTQEVDRRDRASGGADVLGEGEKDSCAKGLLSGEDVPDERSKDAEPVRAIVKTEDFEG